MMATGRKNAPNSGYHSAQPLMFKLPPFARLGVVVLIAGAGVGILATTSTLPVVSSGVVAAARPQSTPAPAPWFDMKVASADLSFKMPRSMPAGAPAIRGQAGILVHLYTGEILWAKQPDLE